MTILILDNYDSFTYNLYQMVQGQTDLPVRVLRNNALDWPDLQELNPSHIILSPGPGHPGNPADFGICREVVLNAAALACPVLGVCLGHQGIVYHLGGRVVPAPDIVHGKTSAVRICQASPLLEGLSSPFTAMRYHSWMVDGESLPAELEILAETVEPEGCEPIVMAIRHKVLPLYGVQFHPESIGTPEGGRLLLNFLNPASIPAVC